MFFSYLRITVLRVVNSRPDKAVITVKPQRLIFNKMYDKQNFSVEFLGFNTTSTGNSTSSNDTAFGYVIWESDSHTVKTPVVLAWTYIEAPGKE